METQADRLKVLRKEAHLTQLEAAQKLGVSQQTWHSAEKGKTFLSRRNLEAVAKAFKINLGWLLTGEGSQIGESIHIKNVENKKLVKLISGRVLAGLVSSYTQDEPEIIDHIYIPGIRSNKECLAIEISGNSMEPEIYSESIVVLEPLEDRGDFKDGKEYVVIAEGIPLLKKVSIILSGKDKGRFELSSYNEDKIHVIGEEDIQAWYRVIYVVNPR